MSATQRLAELGLVLPAVPSPVASYVAATKIGDQIWTSGQLPFQNGALEVTGKVGAEVTAEEAHDCARVAALNALAAASELAGGIDNLERILKVVVFVASDADFTGQPGVANGASDLIGEIFGPAGEHVRSAVGVSVLPLNAPVEIELVVEVR